MYDSYDVLLVAPPHGGYYDGSRFENQGIAQLTAILRKEGFRVHIIDAFVLNLNVEETVERINEAYPTLMLGFSIMQYAQFRSFVDIMKRLDSKKNNKAKIVLGGAFPTMSYDEVLNRNLKIDLIVLSEADLIIKDLIWDIKKESEAWKTRRGFIYKDGKRIINTGYPIIPENLQSLPTPHHDNLLKCLELGWPSVIHSSRGCDWGSCTFCCIGRRYPGETIVRRRSLESVIEEIQLSIKYNAPFILFTDDNFLNDSSDGKKWLYGFIDRMKELNICIPFGISTRVVSFEEELLKGLCSIGLKSVFLGIEGCMERTLRLFNKGYTVQDIHSCLKMILAHSVIVACGFIMFDPEASINDIRVNIEFMRQYPFMGRFQLNQLHVLPEAPIKKYYANKDMLTLCETGLKAIYKDPLVDMVKETASCFHAISLHTVGALFACWFHRLTLASDDPLVLKYDEIAAQIRLFDLDCLNRWCDMVESGETLDINHEAENASVEMKKHLMALDYEQVISEISAKTKWSKPRG